MKRLKKIFNLTDFHFNLKWEEKVVSCSCQSIALFLFLRKEFFNVTQKWNIYTIQSNNLFPKTLFLYMSSLTLDLILPLEQKFFFPLVIQAGNNYLQILAPFFISSHLLNPSVFKLPFLPTQHSSCVLPTVKQGFVTYLNNLSHISGICFILQWFVHLLMSHNSTICF